MFRLQLQKVIYNIYNIGFQIRARPTVCGRRTTKIDIKLGGFSNKGLMNYESTYNLGQNEWNISTTPPPPPPHFNDGFWSSRDFIIALGGGGRGFIVPFYSVLDCSYVLFNSLLISR